MQRSEIRTIQLAIHALYSRTGVVSLAEFEEYLRLFLGREHEVSYLKIHDIGRIFYNEYLVHAEFKDGMIVRFTYSTRHTSYRGDFESFLRECSPHE